MKTLVAMGRFFEIFILAVAASGIASSAFHAAAQSGQPASHPSVLMPDQLTYQATEGAPACMTSAVIQGDPAAGPATMVLKFAPGCNIPMHWHSASEQIVIIKGNGVVQTKGEAQQSASAGAYGVHPAKEPHRFACGADGDCLIYLFTDGKFDIHWLDEQGAEVPLDQVK